MTVAGPLQCSREVLGGRGARQCAAGEVFQLTLALAGAHREEMEKGAQPDTRRQDAAAGPPARPPPQDELPELGRGAAMTRHLGRKFDIYGSSLQEQAYIDLLMDTVEDIRRKYTVLAFSEQLFGVHGGDARQVYWMEVVDPSFAGSTGGGTDFQLLEQLLRRSSGEQGWAVGDRPSIADVLLYNIVELHCQVFGEGVLEKFYPGLVSLMRRFARLPCIAAYLGSRAGDVREL